MDEEEQDFILLSGVISNDSEDGSISISLDDTYTLVCKSYQLKRDNKICEISPVSKNAVKSVESIGPLNIKVQGEVNIQEHSSFISLLDEISSRTTAFVLSIDGYSYENMILKSFESTIDSYGIYAKCALAFSQLTGE